MTEKTFSFKELADEVGVTEAELIQMAQENGLIDSDGKPTEFAIREGLFFMEEPASNKEPSLTFKEIADLLGTSEAEVSHIAQKNGLEECDMPTYYGLREGLQCTDEPYTEFSLN